MQTMIDCYGHPANSERYQRKNFAPKPFLVEKSGNSVTYVCFYDKPIRAIHKITVEGTLTTIAWAWGAWEDRESLEYVTPLDTPITVTLDD